MRRECGRGPASVLAGAPASFAGASVRRSIDLVQGYCAAWRNSGSRVSAVMLKIPHVRPSRANRARTNGR